MVPCTGQWDARAKSILFFYHHTHFPRHGAPSNKHEPCCSNLWCALTAQQGVSWSLCTNLWLIEAFLGTIVVPSQVCHCYGNQIRSNRIMNFLVFYSFHPKEPNAYQFRALQFATCMDDWSFWSWCDLHSPLKLRLFIVPSV